MVTSLKKNKRRERWNSRAEPHKIISPHLHLGPSPLDILLAEDDPVSIHSLDPHSMSLLKRKCKPAGDDHHHPKRRPAIGQLIEDEVTVSGGPDHLQIGKGPEQRRRGKIVSTDQAPVPESGEETKQQQEAAFVQRQYLAIEAPRQNERQQHRADECAVEERRARVLVGELARQ